MIALDGVVVRRGRFTVGPVDVSFPPGAVVALVGPNGSGKTTLLRGLLGLAGRAQGRLVVDGTPLPPGSRALRAAVAWMPDDPDELLPELTAREYLSFVAAGRAGSPGAPDARSVLARGVELAAELDLQLDAGRIAGFSHGMRSKVQLVAALMSAPRVLFLDEPRNGLDPLALLRLETLIAEAAASGTSVVVSSHDLDWVDRVATSWLVLAKGRVLAAGDLPAGGRVRDDFFTLVGGHA